MIFVLDTGGGALQPVVRTGTNHGIEICRDGKTLVFSRMSAIRPAEIYRCGADGSALAPVTRANDGLFKGLQIPPPENVSYAGAGGTPIQAWLYKPPKFDPRRKYPLVLLIHGGPQGSRFRSPSRGWTISSRRMPRFAW